MYRDPVIQKYIELIKAHTGTRFKEFYQGDPIRIPASKLPCVIISKTETRIGAFDNMRDEHAMQLVLTVVTDMRQDYNDADAIANGVAQLYEFIEGRNADFTLKDEAILNVLREHDIVDEAQTLRTDLGTITRASYGITVDKRAENGFATEAQVEFISQFITPA